MHKIALISTNKFKFSETFIQKHRELLPFEVHYLYGGYLPNYFGEGFQFLEGIDYPELEVERHKEMKWQLQEAISAYLKEHKIDAVLAEYGNSGVEMMEICETLQLPLIVHFHGFDAYRDDVMQHYGARYPEMFQKANSVIAVSKHMQQRLLNLGCPPEKISYNPYGPDDKLFGFGNAAHRQPVFLAVSRFDATKAPHLTILAFAEVHKQISQSKLIMAGDGHLLESCKTLVKSLGLTTAVEFPGVQTHQAIADLMQQAKVFVQHSVTTSANDTEGTPVAIIEACHCGLPIVSTVHAGIPDVVTHGENGFLVQEGDFNSMANFMIRLAKEDALAAEMGRKGHETVRSRFTLRRHIDQLAEVISSCIKSGTAQSVK